MKLFLTNKDIQEIEGCNPNTATNIMAEVRKYTLSKGGASKRGKCVTRDYAELYHLDVDDIYLFFERREDGRGIC